MQDQKTLRITIILTSLLALTLAAVFCFIWYQDRYGIHYENIDYIKERMKGPKSFVDLDDSIAVKDINDIGFKQNSNRMLTLYYGKVIIVINDKEMKSKEWTKALSEIGIKIKYKKDDDGNYKYRLTYWGDPIAEWSYVGGD